MTTTRKAPRPPVMQGPYGEIKSEYVTHCHYGEFIITHAIWHNGYGECPETGIRRGEAFCLCQHGSTNWLWVTETIIKCLDKGKTVTETAELVQKIADRRRDNALRAVLL